jgi:hypothetical protein
MPTNPAAEPDPAAEADALAEADGLAEPGAFAEAGPVAAAVLTGAVAGGLALLPSEALPQPASRPISATSIAAAPMAFSFLFMVVPLRNI